MKINGHRYLVPCPVKDPAGLHTALYEPVCVVVVPYPHEIAPLCHYDKTQCVFVVHITLVEFYIVSYYYQKNVMRST